LLGGFLLVFFLFRLLFLTIGVGEARGIGGIRVGNIEGRIGVGNIEGPGVGLIVGLGEGGVVGLGDGLNVGRLVGFGDGFVGSASIAAGLGARGANSREDLVPPRTPPYSASTGKQPATRANTKIKKNILFRIRDY